LLAVISVRDQLDATFGPQVVFMKAPNKEQGQNLPPSEGMQFFGTIAIDGASETALAVRQLVKEQTGLLIPVWAALSANGIQSVEVPSRVFQVKIFPDHDQPTRFLFVGKPSVGTARSGWNGDRVRSLRWAPRFHDPETDHPVALQPRGDEWIAVSDYKLGLPFASLSPHMD
jgi:hypothetical protein